MKFYLTRNKKNLTCAIALVMGLTFSLRAQVIAEDSVFMGAVWVADNGDGTYTNPILFADYSDPDIVKAGTDFYMVASSFNCMPGIPVLHSKDLVNWTIINHIFNNQEPNDVYDKPGHGNGVWAPSIRYHKDTFYVFYGDPDYGVHMGKTTDPAGVWKHMRVHDALGWIDVCPFWDDNDSAYIVHAYAKSRIGFKSKLTIRRMSQNGETIYAGPEDSIMVIDGNLPEHTLLTTIEGPKFYKRNGYYYIFAPYGGVAEGSQVVLRADTLIGPWEYKTVLEQGSTNVNGPHQGGWVELESGESWFMHFQEVQPYGRIVHLQPMSWVDDWPVMGEDYDENGIGEPVKTHAKPDVGATYPIVNPQTSDKFNSEELGLQWQWHSNVDSAWFSTTDIPGHLRLYAASLPDDYLNLWDVGSMLLQKLPTPTFSATAKIDYHLNPMETAGIVAMGQDYAKLESYQIDDSVVIYQRQCLGARDGGTEKKVSGNFKAGTSSVYLRLDYKSTKYCIFSYSKDGINYTRLGSQLYVDEGRWIGAKFGLYCHRPNSNEGDPGYIDIDWINVDKIRNQPAVPTSNPIPANADSITITDAKLTMQWTYDYVFADSMYVYLDMNEEPTTLVAKQRTYKFSPDASKLEIGQKYYWRVDTKNAKGTTTGPVWSFTVKDKVSAISDVNALNNNLAVVPNPVLGDAQINFDLTSESFVQLALYDMNGRLIKTIANNSFNAGTHAVHLSSDDLPAGVYIVKLKTDRNSAIQRIVIN